MSENQPAFPAPPAPRALSGTQTGTPGGGAGNWADEGTIRTLRMVRTRVLSAHLAQCGRGYAPHDPHDLNRVPPVLIPILGLGYILRRPRGQYPPPRTIQLPITEWVTKEEAAVLLGSIAKPLSTRRVLELAKGGKLEFGRTRDPNTNHMVVRIKAGSIERYLEKKRNPDPVPGPEECESREPYPPSRNDRIAQRAIREFLELLAGSADSTHLRTPLWLTVDQAADYSGLPAPILRSMVLSGQLEVLEVGRRRGGRWRLSRRDLESIHGQRRIGSEVVVG